MKFFRYSCDSGAAEIVDSSSQRPPPDQTKVLLNKPKPRQRSVVASDVVSEVACRIGRPRIDVDAVMSAILTVVAWWK